MNYCILATCGISAASSAAAEHTAGEIATKILSRTDLRNTPGSGWSSSLSAGEKNLKTPNCTADIWQDWKPALTPYPQESWGTFPEWWLSTVSMRTLKQQSGCKHQTGIAPVQPECLVGQVVSVSTQGTFLFVHRELLADSAITGQDSLRVPGITECFQCTNDGTCTPLQVNQHFSKGHRKWIQEAAF